VGCVWSGVGGAVRVGGIGVNWGGEGEVIGICVG
jgi:hypothetical protein